MIAWHLEHMLMACLQLVQRARPGRFLALTVGDGLMLHRLSLFKVTMSNLVP